MKTHLVEFLIDFVRKNSGIVISKEKTYLIESRLTPLVKKYGFDDIDNLLDQLQKGTGKVPTTAIIDAMTTNESFFFRDNKPFEIFRNEVLPSLISANNKSRRIRIWSAAASTGQEPYSLAMIVREMARELAGFRVEIVGTDICSEAIERAKAGRFSQFEVQRGLKANLLVKYFEKSGDAWQVKPDLKTLIQFKEHNLNANNKALGQFDVVFLRNVLIYFDVALKRKILEDIAGMIQPDGYVCLGGTETILGVTDKLIPCRHVRGLYQRSEPIGQRPNLAATA